MHVSNICVHALDALVLLANINDWSYTKIKIGLFCHYVISVYSISKYRATEMELCLLGFIIYPIFNTFSVLEGFS